VRTVAQRLILALSASAELDQRPAVQIELPAVLIKQLKIPFDVNTPVAFDGDLGRHGRVPCFGGRRIGAVNWFSA
jgi:hypothetical protein